jgi:hypothetical protein
MKETWLYPDNPGLPPLQRYVLELDHHGLIVPNIEVQTFEEFPATSQEGFLRGRFLHLQF